MLSCIPCIYMALHGLSNIGKLHLMPCVHRRVDGKIGMLVLFDNMTGEYCFFSKFLNPKQPRVNLMVSQKLRI